MITYILIAICNAFIWSALAVLLGASTGRAVAAFALVFMLSFVMLLFIAGCGVGYRKPYYLGEK